MVLTLPRGAFRLVGIRGSPFTQRHQRQHQQTRGVKKMAAVIMGAPGRSMLELCLSQTRRLSVRGCLLAGYSSTRWFCEQDQQRVSELISPTRGNLFQAPASSDAPVYVCATESTTSPPTAAIAPVAVTLRGAQGLAFCTS